MRRPHVVSCRVASIVEMTYSMFSEREFCKKNPPLLAARCRDSSTATEGGCVTPFINDSLTVHTDTQQSLATEGPQAEMSSCATDVATHKPSGGRMLEKTGVVAGKKQKKERRHQKLEGGNSRLTSARDHQHSQEGTLTTEPSANAANFLGTGRREGRKKDMDAEKDTGRGGVSSVVVSDDLVLRRLADLWTRLVVRLALNTGLFRYALLLQLTLFL